MNKKALISLVSLLAMAGGYILASAQVPPPPPGIGACSPSYLDASANILAGFGAPYNLFSAAKELLIGGTCSSNSVDLSVGTSNQSPVTYVYNKGYIWRNNQWREITYTSNSPLLGNVWYKSSAQASVPLTPQELSKDIYVIAYTCSEVSPGQFKCGCRDTTCATNQWQLQKFSPGSGLPPPGGGGGGGGGGGTTATELKMDPDGPSGPMAPQSGTVVSKLFVFGVGEQEKASTPENPGKATRMAYLTWTGGSSCTLDEYVPDPIKTNPGFFSSQIENRDFLANIKSQLKLTYSVSGSSAMVPLPNNAQTKFVLTCGSTSSVLVAGSQSSGTAGIIYADSSIVGVGAPKVDIKASVSGSSGQEIGPYGFPVGVEGGPYEYGDIGKRINCLPGGRYVPESCLGTVIWSAVNASHCFGESTRNGYSQGASRRIRRTGPDGREGWINDGVIAVERVQTLAPDTVTITCTGPGGTASDSVVIQ